MSFRLPRLTIFLHSTLRRAFASTAPLLIFLSAPAAFSQQTPAQTPTPTQGGAAQTTLDKIEFVGLRRVKREEAVAATGLQAGQAVDVDVVDAAGNRLLDSGLFKKLSYSFRASKGLATVVFNVEELASQSPVVFDNFVWFSDKELNEFVRKNVPAFDGTAPESDAVIENIARVLGELLRLRGVEGKVEYRASADPVARTPEHLFAVKVAEPLRICSLKFAGAAALKEETLMQNSVGIMSSEYSRQFIRSYAESNLVPLYRERGHLRAAFRTPQAKPAAAGDSCSGVNVTVPVDEGTAYVWGGAEWYGNAALDTKELDAALGMTARERANGAKIDKGVEAVRRAYARKGHLTAKVTATPAFDDAARSVAYRLGVNEGPQYRMGELIIKGLSEKDTNNLKGRWSMLPREPYDPEYLKQFVQKTVAEFMRDPTNDARALGPLKTDGSEAADRERLTVDVTIDFKPQK